MSIAEEKRRAWLRQHNGRVVQYHRQLTRRPPYRYETVYAVDWTSTNGDWCSGNADWGTATPIQAIEKAMKCEALRT